MIYDCNLGKKTDYTKFLLCVKHKNNEKTEALLIKQKDEAIKNLIVDNQQKDKEIEALKVQVESQQQDIEDQRQDIIFLQKHF